MNAGYIKYLIYLILLIALFGLFLSYVNKRKRSKPKADSEKVSPISSGNISVFFDPNENAVIISYVTDLFGVGKASGVPVVLNTPYSFEELGKAIREAMSFRGKAVPCSDTNLMKMLGFRNWREFSYGKRNISVHYREGYGVVFNSTIRKSDGAYQFNHMGFEKVASSNVSNMELGKTLKETLQKCRC